MTETALTPYEHDSYTLATLTTPQRELIRSTIAKGANDLQLDLFIQFCQSTALDPFKKQVYAIVRNSKDGPHMTIQIAIDGYRLIAQRSRQYEGQEGPYWCGPDGQWVDVWLDDENPPVAAKIAVLRAGFRSPTWGVAKYKEYVQKVPIKWDANKRPAAWGPNEMWRSMPSNQLAKCAEAQALRKAFAQEVADLARKHDVDVELMPDVGFEVNVREPIRPPKALVEGPADTVDVAIVEGEPEVGKSWAAAAKAAEALEAEGGPLPVMLSGEGPLTLSASELAEAAAAADSAVVIQQHQEEQPAEASQVGALEAEVLSDDESFIAELGELLAALGKRTEDVARVLHVERSQKAFLKWWKWEIEQGVADPLAKLRDLLLAEPQTGLPFE